MLLICRPVNSHIDADAVTAGILPTSRFVGRMRYVGRISYSTIGLGVLSLGMLGFNIYSLVSLTERFRVKKYYIPIFVVSMIQVIKCLTQLLIVIFETLVVSYYFLIGILQITMLTFTFIMLVKVKFLEDLMQKTPIRWYIAVTQEELHTATRAFRYFNQYTDILRILVRMRRSQHPVFLHRRLHHEHDICVQLAVPHSKSHK